MSCISCKTGRSPKDGREGDHGKLCAHKVQIARIPPRTFYILTFGMFTRSGRGRWADFSLARFFAACTLFSLLVRSFRSSTLTENLAQARTKSAKAQIRVVNEFPRSRVQKLLLMTSLNIQK